MRCPNRIQSNFWSEVLTVAPPEGYAEEGMGEGGGGLGMGCALGWAGEVAGRSGMRGVEG